MLRCTCWYSSLECSVLLAYEKFSTEEKESMNTLQNIERFFRSNGLRFLTAIKEFLLYDIVVLFYSNFIYFTTLYFVNFRSWGGERQKLKKRSKKRLRTIWDLLLFTKVSKTFRAFKKFQQWSFLLLRHGARCTFTIKIS